MPRKKAAPVLATADPQTKSKLLSDLPPELRTIVWEFALYVEPSSNGTVTLRPAMKKSSSDENKPRAERRTEPRSVLALLQTCRLVNREASGIFFNMHHFSLENSYNYHPDYFYKLPGGNCFVDPTQPLERLSAIKCLTIKTATPATFFEFQQLTRACKEISRLLPRLESLTFELKDGQFAIMNQMWNHGNDGWFLKKAVAKLPVSMKEFKLVLVESSGLNEVLHPAVKEIVEDIFFNKLPKVEKKELLVRVEEAGDR